MLLNRSCGAMLLASTSREWRGTLLSARGSAQRAAARARRVLGCTRLSGCVPKVNCHLLRTQGTPRLSAARGACSRENPPS
jgi:hypothetical protein